MSIRLALILGRLELILAVLLRPPHLQENVDVAVQDESDQLQKLFIQAALILLWRRQYLIRLELRLVFFNFGIEVPREELDQFFVVDDFIKGHWLHVYFRELLLKFIKVRL